MTRVTKAAASLEDVTISFGDAADASAHLALDSVSLDVAQGEFVVIVGRSGCGKTTVLNALAGLVNITSGTVSVLGEPPAKARSRVGYMFARDALVPWRTAVRNVEFALELRCPTMTRRERRARGSELLSELGIVGESQKRYPWQLSQGMRQRVALARTWAIDPEVVLMDEPFAALDAQTRTDAQAIFLETWARHRKTVVFVTHDMNEAILLADRIIVMEAGKVIDDATVEIPRPREHTSIIGDPTFVQLHRRLATAIQR